MTLWLASYVDGSARNESLCEHKHNNKQTETTVTLCISSEESHSREKTSRRQARMLERYKNSGWCVTEKTTSTIRHEGCPRTTNLDVDSKWPTLPLLQHPRPRLKDPRSDRTYCKERTDSRAPRTTPACCRRPARGRGTAATASEAASNTPDDTGPQQSTGDLHTHMHTMCLQLIAGNPVAEQRSITGCTRPHKCYQGGLVA